MALVKGEQVAAEVVLAAGPGDASQMVSFNYLYGTTHVIVIEDQLYSFWGTLKYRYLFVNPAPVCVGRFNFADAHYTAHRRKSKRRWYCEGI